MFEDLLSYCHRALEICEAEGAEEAEIFALARSSTSFRFSTVGGESSFEASSTMRLGIAIRTFKEGKMGFSYTTDLSDEALREAAKSALKASMELPSFKGFPSPPGARKLSIFDRGVVELSEEECLERLRSLMDYATSGRKGLSIPSAWFGKSIVRFGVVNSSGLEAEDVGTFVGASLTARAEGAPSPVGSSRVRRKLSDLDLEGLAEECASLSLLTSRAGEVEPGSYDLVLSPAVAAELLAYAFVSSLRADNVRLGTSVLKDKIGEEVASPVLSVWDDPFNELGLCSFGIDDEGVPVKAKALVEKGVLKSFMCDSLEASAQGLEPTGNCVRWEPPLVDPFYPRDYRFRPSIYPINMALRPGQKALEELLSELGEGIYAHRSLSGFGMRPSGEFSLYVPSGFLVEGGELKQGLRGFSMRGNVFDLLKKVEGLSSEQEPLLPNMAGFCIIAPHVLVRGVEVST